MSAPSFPVMLFKLASAVVCSFVAGYGLAWLLHPHGIAAAIVLALCGSAIGLTVTPPIIEGASRVIGWALGGFQSGPKS